MSNISKELLESFVVPEGAALMPKAASDIPPKTRKSRKGGGAQRAKNVEIDWLHKRVLTVLDREVYCLMRDSYKWKKLGKEDAQSLVNYLKLIREIKKEEEREFLQTLEEKI
jgi:hypothetical protein